jgi:hypothetical protein
VHRFANRIPLLFEAGSDVATRVANKKIKWGSYKIDAKKDKVNAKTKTIKKRGQTLSTSPSEKGIYVCMCVYTRLAQRTQLGLD